MALLSAAFTGYLLFRALTLPAWLQDKSGSPDCILVGQRSYGVALALAALAVFPETSWMAAVILSSVERRFSRSQPRSARRAAPSSLEIGPTAPAGSFCPTLRSKDEMAGEAPVRRSAAGTATVPLDLPSGAKQLNSYM
jgi:hypothetical protein